MNMPIFLLHSDVYAHLCVACESAIQISLRKVQVTRPRTRGTIETNSHNVVIYSSDLKIVSITCLYLILVIQ